MIIAWGSYRDPWSALQWVNQGLTSPTTPVPVPVVTTTVTGGIGKKRRYRRIILPDGTFWQVPESEVDAVLQAYVKARQEEARREHRKPPPAKDILPKVAKAVEVKPEQSAYLAVAEATSLELANARTRTERAAKYVELMAVLAALAQDDEDDIEILLMV